VNLAHYLYASSVAFAAQLRHFSAHAAAVGRVIRSFHQAICFEAIHQLGNIRTDACKFLGQLAQTKRTIFRNENGQRGEFRPGQIHGRQNLLKAGLDPMGRMYQRDYNPFVHI
jgi:hypothetical protein